MSLALHRPRSEEPGPDPDPPGNSPVRQLINLAAVAARIGVGKATAERMHAGGRLPLPIRLGARLIRWDPEELDEWLSCRRPDGSLLSRDEWARHRSARNARK